AALRPAVGMRLARWWQHLISGDAPPPDEESAPISVAGATGVFGGMATEILTSDPPSIPPPTPAAPEAAPAQVHALIEQRQMTTGHSPGLAVYCFGNFRSYLNDTLVERWESARGRALFKYLVARRATPVPK